MDSYDNICLVPERANWCAIVASSSSEIVFENLLPSVVADGLLICSVFIPLAPLLRIGQVEVVNVQRYIALRCIEATDHWRSLATSASTLNRGRQIHLARKAKA